MSGSDLTVALAGNPNSGKTTLFNAITGDRQHVGNYPGVTVEKKEGARRHNGRDLCVVDLPGTYSLTAYSVEEVVARNFLIDEEPDVLVDIIDSSNLERNLYLATQFLELGVPVVLAFNMVDVARSRGFRIDTRKLSQLLGVPILSTVAHKGHGVEALLDKVVEIAEDPAAAVAHQSVPRYGREIEPHVRQLAEMITQAGSAESHRARWFALKLLENDEQTRTRLEHLYPGKAQPIFAEADRLREHIESVCGDAPETVLADRRYGFISGACTEAVRQSSEARHDVSDRIDKVLIHRWLGLPVFALLMYLTFQLTFTIGEPLMGWIEGGFGYLGETVAHLWPKGTDSMLKSLLVDGIIGGVGGVLVFLPNILLLFLAIAFLEDSGYMARAAFIMDHLMHKIGLHGKSFIPMLIGFGCTVPAVLATRTLETRRDRLTTMLIAPLMSCGARFPIYLLIIPAMFSDRILLGMGPIAIRQRAMIMFSIYLIGIVLAVVAAKVLRGTIFKGDATPFVMELPPYRMPTVKGLIVHMWERSWMYVRKAGTIILAASILMWALTKFPEKRDYEKDYAALSATARAEYVTGAAADLGAGLPRPGDAGLLARTLREDLDLQTERDAHWEHADAFAAAEKRRGELLGNLSGQGGGQAVLASFQTREPIAELHAAFDRDVQENQWNKDSDEYRQAQRVLDARLGALSKENPLAYNAAVKYLALTETLEQFDRERQAEELSYTVAGRVGRFFEPVLKTMGFDWRIGTALIGASAAKEMFVAQLGIVYSVGEADETSETLRQKLREKYSPLVGFCICLFCLITMPCVATVAVTWRESGSWKLALFQSLALTVMAYVITTAVYQAGTAIAGIAA